MQADLTVAAGQRLSSHAMSACWQGGFWYRPLKLLGRPTRERKITMSLDKPTTLPTPLPSSRMQSDRCRSFLARCAQFHRSTALILLNTLVLLVLINLALWGTHRVEQMKSPPS